METSSDTGKGAESGPKTPVILKVAGLILILVAGLTVANAFLVYTTGRYVVSEDGIGTVFGTVENESGDPVAAVEVSTGDRSVMTDETGGYEFVLATGQQHIEFSKPGYSTVIVETFVIADERAEENTNEVSLTMDNGLFMEGPMVCSPSGDCDLLLNNTGNGSVRVDGETHLTEGDLKLENISTGPHNISFNTSEADYSFRPHIPLPGVVSAHDVSSGLNTTIGNALNSSMVVSYRRAGVWDNITLAPGEDTSIPSSGPLDMTIRVPGHCVLNLTAGPGIAFRVKSLNLTETYRVELAQPEDFTLCSTMLGVLTLFILMGAWALLKGRPLMLGYVGAGAAVINLISPYYLSQIGGLAVLALLAYHMLTENGKGGG